MNYPQIERGDAGPGFSGEIPFPEPIRVQCDETTEELSPDRERIVRAELACLNAIAEEASLTTEQLDYLRRFIEEKKALLGTDNRALEETE